MFLRSGVVHDDFVGPPVDDPNDAIEVRLVWREIDATPSSQGLR
jgi:hypothetical protein